MHSKFVSKNIAFALSIACACGANAGLYRGYNCHEDMEEIFWSADQAIKEGDLKGALALVKPVHGGSSVRALILADIAQQYCNLECYRKAEKVLHLEGLQDFKGLKVLDEVGARIKEAKGVNINEAMDNLFRKAREALEKGDAKEALSLVKHGDDKNTVRAEILTKIAYESCAQEMYFDAVDAFSLLIASGFGGSKEVRTLERKLKFDLGKGGLKLLLCAAKDMNEDVE